MVENKEQLKQQVQGLEEEVKSLQEQLEQKKNAFKQMHPNEPEEAFEGSPDEPAQVTEEELEGEEALTDEEKSLMLEIASLQEELTRKQMVLIAMKRRLEDAEASDSGYFSESYDD